MKKILFLLMCASLSIGASAQLKKVKISSAQATSQQSGEDASRAIDGDVNTLWHSQYTGTTFPVTFTATFASKTHVDLMRYVPRTNGDNGNWLKVEVEYSESKNVNKWESVGTYNLSGSGSYDFQFGDAGYDVARVRFRILEGKGGWASAAEVEAYVEDNTKRDAFAAYFEDELFSVLKPEVTSSDNIEDEDVKTLVDNLLADAEGYRKFRVGEYEPYRTLGSLQNETKTKNQYNQWENPTGIYLKPGDSFYVVVSGIGNDKVGLKIKNWVNNEDGSSYSLRNGLNNITATTEGNVFVDYYTDNYKTAPNVKVHFINAPVRGYWDQQTMTNKDWKQMLSKLPNDNSVIIVRSEHAQLAYPVSAWKTYCPENIDSLMTLYQQVQWACRDLMGWEKYGRQNKNRQLYYATTYGFMAAGSQGAYCNVSSLSAIMAPDSKKFDFWGVGHEWGHNNQISPGFHWPGCGETTNNIYASWAQLHFTGNRSYLRLEDENSGVGEYSGMRGGRMQTYFEEALRKGVQWQLQDGPDYHGANPETKSVPEYDYNGNLTGKMVNTTSRNYDHFVKLTPFWQLNLWGTLAGKCPDIIPMVIEGIRTTPNYSSTYKSAGLQQINWMKLACDSSKIDLLPFFEKAGMLKPIKAYIEDYGAGWSMISQDMVNKLKAHVAEKGYPAFTEEINYINGHNFHIYRDNLKLDVPTALGTGCTYDNSGKVKVDHTKVKNAVAFETYNSADSLIRITMYGLGSNDSHSFTMVLYPAATEEADASAYIVAVGYDGTRQKIYENANVQKGIEANRYYTITNVGRGNALSCGTNTSVNTKGEISWSLSRASLSTSFNFVWYIEKRDDKTYLYNPQSDSYFTGSSGAKTEKLVDKKSAPAWNIVIVDETKGTCTLELEGSGQYINAYSATETGLWGGGAGDNNNIWTIEEVKSFNLSIPASGCYNACFPVAVQVPEKVETYVAGEFNTITVDGTSYSYVLLDKVEGDIVPARMPVIFVGNRGSYTLNFVPEDETPLTTPNMLHGATLKVTGVTKGTLMNTISLSDDTTVPVFKASTTATTAPANRSYLLTTDVDGATQVSIETEDPTTGIDELKDSTSSDKVFYNLNGTRAKKLQSGSVYITSDGKTILVK